MPQDETRRAQTAAVVGELRRAALTYGCTKIRLISQAYGPVQSAIDSLGSGGGVCRELAIQWLANQKKGVDFLGKLLGVGGVVNERLMTTVVQDYQSMGEKNRLEQREYVENRLRKLGLSVGPRTEVINHSVGGGRSLSNWFCDTLRAVGPLRFLGIRDGVEHAVAANLSPGKESFFDPNLGEFQFFGRKTNMESFLHAQIFPPAAAGLGTYIKSPNKVFAQAERLRCF